MSTTTKPTAWTPAENKLIVAAYFEMLVASQRGERINKSKVRRELIVAMAQEGAKGSTDFTPAFRSEASVEFKMRNVSQVVRECGYAHLKGYLPAENVQVALRQAVQSELLERGLAITTNTEVLNLPTK